MTQQEEGLISSGTIVLILYVIVIVIGLLFFIVGFFIAFQKRKNKLLLEQLKAQQQFKEELSNTQLEIQEQTFKNIAWELHDNVGQLLSVISMQLNMMLVNAPENIATQIKDTKTVVSDTVQEIRNLSKTLNTDVVQKNGLIRSLQIEVERFNKLKFLKASFAIEGDEVAINSEHEILIFRMYQEFLSNVMRHSKADELSIKMHFKKDELEIIAEDNGIGFDTTQKTESSGLQTIKGRAVLLNAKFLLSSKIGRGTRLSLLYPYPNDTESRI